MTLPTKEELDESLALAHTAKASGFKTVACDVDVLIETLAAARTLHAVREASGLDTLTRQYLTRLADYGSQQACVSDDATKLAIDEALALIDSLSLRLAERERRIGELEGLIVNFAKWDKYNIRKDDAPFAAIKAESRRLAQEKQETK